MSIREEGGVRYNLVCFSASEAGARQRIRTASAAVKERESGKIFLLAGNWPAGRQAGSSVREVEKAGLLGGE